MLDKFERGLCRHIEEHFPTHWRVMGAAQMAEVVRFGVGRAKHAGYRSERDGYLFNSLMLSFGSHFDTDPQYPWLVKALMDDTVGPRSQRLLNAHDAAMRYLDAVAGERGEHMAAALQRVKSTVIPELGCGPRVNFDYVLGILDLIWPQKVAQLGESALRALAQSVIPDAKCIGLTSPASACMYVVACFMFGHGLMRDPQFPWAASIRSKVVPAQDGTKLFREALVAQLAALEG
jgi:hypothetical protein